MRKGGTKKGEKHKEKKWSGVIGNSETVKREAKNRNNESEQGNPLPSFSRSYNDRFISRQG